MSFLTRESLHHVLQSLIKSELRQIRQKGAFDQVSAHTGAWPETLPIGEGDASGLACDSIEQLWLAGAVNEMFCLADSRAENGLLSANTFGAWLDVVDRGWNQGGRRVTFGTSGSTGAPKRCTHAMADLQREVSYLAERFSAFRRVVALAPSHHIYGFLFTALLPSHGQMPWIAAERLAPGVLAAELREGDLLVSTPLWWEWLLRSVSSWPQGVHGICSTAPCPDQWKQQLMQSGLSGFTEVYGSTETAGVGLRTYPADRYTLMPFWTWAVRDLRSPSVRDQAGKTVVLQDQLDISADGSFLVGQRQDGAVQIGGVNVFPTRVEDLLRAVPGVAEVSVRLSSEFSPPRLKAFIVPEGAIEDVALAATLEAWTMGFPAPERVCSFTFGPALPRNELGKSSDWSATVAGSLRLHRG